MDNLDIKVGDIILVRDHPIRDISDKLLLVLDNNDIGFLCALINNETNGISLTNNDLEEGQLIDRVTVIIEKLFTIYPINYQKIGSLKKDSLDKILRTFTKYAASIYFKNFHSNRTLNKISASGKIVDENDLYNLIDASLDMWLTAGRFTEEFESTFPKILGRKYCVLVNSGSSANLLAISALTSYKLGESRLRPGDEVITVAAGFPTTIAPIIQNKLVPVFVDVELGTYNIDVGQLEKAISNKTKAIFIAHTLGNPFNVSKVLEITKKYNLWLIEDNCDALGSKYSGKYTGTFGDISTFSFYPAHHITMGEGGAILTDDPELYKIILSFRDWGRDCWCPPGRDNTCGRRFSWKLGDLPFGYDHKYIYSHLGYNLKATDFQAAIGLSQLKKLPDFIKKRKENFNLLYEGFKKEGLDKYFILPIWLSESEPSWFGFPLTIKDEAEFNREDLIKYLEKNNIGTRLLFAGNIIKQPAFTNSDIEYKIIGDLKNTDKIMRDTFWIGVWPGIKNEDIEYMIKQFNLFIGDR